MQINETEISLKERLRNRCQETYESLTKRLETKDRFTEARSGPKSFISEQIKYRALSGLNIYLHLATSCMEQSSIQRKKALTSQLVGLGASCSLSIINSQTIVVLEDKVINALYAT